MLNEHDIKDWQMLTIPLKLKSLEKGSLFSVSGSDKVFKLMQTTPDYCLAETTEILNSFVLPNFMDVFKWQLKS